MERKGHPLTNPERKLDWTENITTDGIVRLMLRDLQSGVVSDDLRFALYDDALNWHAAREITRRCNFYGPIAERLVSALLRPNYRRAVREAITRIGRFHRWPGVKRSVITNDLLFRWERRIEIGYRPPTPEIEKEAPDRVPLPQARRTRQNGNRTR